MREENNFHYSINAFDEEGGFPLLLRTAEYAWKTIFWSKKKSIISFQFFNAIETRHDVYKYFTPSSVPEIICWQIFARVKERSLLFHFHFLSRESQVVIKYVSQSAECAGKRASRRIEILRLRFSHTATATVEMGSMWCKKKKCQLISTFHEPITFDFSLCMNELFEANYFMIFFSFSISCF